MSEACCSHVTVLLLIVFRLQNSHKLCLLWWWTKHTATIQKTYWLFVEGSRVMITSGSAFKNTPVLQQSIIPNLPMPHDISAYNHELRSSSLKSQRQNQCLRQQRWQETKSSEAVAVHLLWQTSFISQKSSSGHFRDHFPVYKGFVDYHST